MMKLKINIIGDSISLGYGLPAKDKSYVDLLIESNKFEVSVFAKCGNDLDAVFHDLNLINKDSDIWIIFIGTNGVIDREKLSKTINYLKTEKNHIILCNLMINSTNNDIINSIAHEKNISICNLNKQSRNKDMLLLNDNIHPNSNGHRVIFKELFKTINSWGI